MHLHMNYRLGMVRKQATILIKMAQMKKIGNKLADIKSKAIVTATTHPVKPTPSTSAMSIIRNKMICKAFSGMMDC